MAAGASTRNHSYTFIYMNEGIHYIFVDGSSDVVTDFLAYGTVTPVTVTQYKAIRLQ